MAKPWLRLDAAFAQHPKIVRAGWPLRALWPCLLAVLKQNDGVLGAEDTDGEYLAACFGGDPATWSAAVGAALSVGLLVDGQREVNMGRAGTKTVSGLMTPNWREYQPDPRRSGAVRKASPGTNMPPREPPSLPGRRDGSPASRAPAVPSRLSDGPELIINKREPLKRAQQHPRRKWSLATLWHKLGPRHGSSARDATGQPTGIQGDRLLTILDACTDEAIETALAASASKTAPLPYFCACFEDDGTPKPKRGAPKNPAVETMRLNEDAEDCAIAMEGNHKQCTPENVVYWLGKHGKEWEPGSFRDRVQHFLTIRGVAS